MAFNTVSSFLSEPWLQTLTQMHSQPNKHTRDLKHPLINALVGVPGWPARSKPSSLHYQKWAPYKVRVVFSKPVSAARVRFYHQSRSGREYMAGATWATMTYLVECPLVSGGGGWRCFCYVGERAQDRLWRFSINDTHLLRLTQVGRLHKSHWAIDWPAT